MRRYERFLFLMLLVVLFPLLAACGQQLRTGETQVVSQTVEVEEAEEVRVDVQMGAGRLEVNSGADNLLEGEFTFNVEGWEPEVTYSESGTQGTLTVRQPASDATEGLPLLNLDDARNEWALRLSDDVPMDLSINMGAGEGRLMLGGLMLDNLDLNLGAGQVTLDLTGDWAQDMDGEIRGGVGQAIVRLPSEVGVRVHVEGGIGQLNTLGLREEGNAYVNDAYDDSDVTLNLDISGGVGEIRLEVIE